MKQLLRLLFVVSEQTEIESILGTTFPDRGIEVSVCHTLEEALRMLHDGAENHTPFDVIFADSEVCRMKGLSTPATVLFEYLSLYGAKALTVLLPVNSATPQRITGQTGGVLILSKCGWGFRGERNWQALLDLTLQVLSHHATQTAAWEIVLSSDATNPFS